MLSISNLSGLFDIEEISDFRWDNTRDQLFVTTGNGNLITFDPNTGSNVNQISIGGVLRGLAFSPDNSRLYVAQGDTVDIVGMNQATIHVVDLVGGSGVTDINYVSDGFSELGVLDIAIGSNGEGLYTTLFAGSGWTSLRTIDTSSDAVGTFSNFPGILTGRVTSPTFLFTSESGRYIFLQEGNISSAPLHVYDIAVSEVIASTDAFEWNDEGFGPVSAFNRGVGDINEAAGLVAAGNLVFDFADDLAGVTDLSAYGFFEGVKFSADGARLYALNVDAGGVIVFSTVDWGVIAAYAQQAPVIGSFFEDTDFDIVGDERLAIIQNDAGIEIIDLNFAPAPSSLAYDFGTASGDALEGTISADIVAGLGGADTINGGDGNDLLHGADGADEISGESGADLITGGEGDDFIVGGAGADTIDGGDGVDSTTYVGAAGAVAVTLDGSLSSGSHANGDSVRNVEIVSGSLFNDRIFGASANESLLGDQGSDSLSGAAGADSLFGNAGNDTLVGGAGADSINGGDGFDIASYGDAAAAIRVALWNPSLNTGDASGDLIQFSTEAIFGSRFADNIQGNDQANNLRGGDGGDLILGGFGNDTAVGGAGADDMGGGAGFDVVSYVGGGAVRVALWNPAFHTGDAAGDNIRADIEVVEGSLFNDTLEGSAAANTLRGSNGNDRILGGGGADTLSGDLGNDTLDGGLGDDSLIGGGASDTFAYASGGGADVIADFLSGTSVIDVVRLTSFGAAFDSFAEVIAAATQNGANVVIAFGAGQSLTLQNIALADLDADDFAFG